LNGIASLENSIVTPELLTFAKVMEHYPFYYIPLTPDYGGEDKGEGV